MARLLSSLPVGSRVKDPESKYDGKEIIWMVLDKDHPGYPAKTTTLLSERILSLKAFDAIEPSSPDGGRRLYGNNRYAHSNIRQWLNKDSQPWFEKQHANDEPPIASRLWSNHNPYDAEPGFLDHLSDGLKASIMPTTLTVAKNTVVDGGGIETVVDKVFLLSNTEVGLANEPGGAEGSSFSYFNSNSRRLANPTPEAVSKSSHTTSSLNANSAWFWWLRSPNSSNSHFSRVVSSSGALSSDTAYYGPRGLRPALNLESDILVSDEPDATGVYTLTFAPLFKFLFKDGDDIKTLDNGEWSVVGSVGDDLSELFELRGMNSVSGIASHISKLSEKKVLVKSSRAPSASIRAIPKSQLVLPKGDIVLRMLDKINSITLFSNKAGSGSVKMLFSIDSGASWNTYDQSTQSFISVDIGNEEEIRLKGMDPDLMNSLGSKWNDAIPDGKVRFAYFIEIEEISDVAEVDRLDINVDITGRWKKAVHDTEYEYEYDNENIYVKFKANGDFKVNYSV